MTLLAWMLQATVLGALFCAAAALLERVTVRRRWVWVATLGLSAVVPFLALLAPSLWPEWASWRIVQAMTAALRTEAGEGAPLPSARGFVVNAVLAVWAVLSLLCGTWYLAGWVRLRRLRRGCVPARLAGCDLLLSERLGPAVIGLWRPRVVAPRWITRVGASRQWMIVLHEVEHLRAGDHWVLALAPVVAVLMPWSVPVWWQLRRLRLVVELDCDARVLSHGIRPLDYGGLLLDVAASDLMLAAPALAEPRSLLERRLQAVARRYRRPGRAHSLALANSAGAALLSAFFVAAPVRVVITATPVSSAALGALPDRAASSTGIELTSTAIVPREDDGSARKKSIDVTRIPVATVKSGAGANVAARRTTRARTREPAGFPVTDAAANAAAGDDVAVQIDDGDSLNAMPRSIVNRPLREPLIIVDGVIVSEGTFAELRLEPDTIERIEVLKGPAAAEQYGLRGADGVVTITTRRSGAGR